MSRRRAALGGIALAACVGVAAAVAAFWAPLPERLEAPSSPVVRYGDDSVAHVFLAPDGRLRVAVDPGAVDPAYVSALLRLEDQRFARHLGVDPLAVARAALTNVRRGRVVSGASTITMQVVRLCEPRPRTLRSKVIEAARAVQLELRMSKADILAAYLQLTPFGRNIEGVEAAAHAYFGHGAGALSPTEIATLLAVPQNPNRRYPSEANGERLRAARDDIARRLAAASELPRGVVEATDAELLERIQAAPVPARLRSVPRDVPHTAYRLRARDPGAREWPTTLDRGVQRVVDDVLAAARPELRNDGIDNGAVVVLDTASGEVLALGGNLSFDADAPGNRIAAFDVPRSPGSTLKPLLYAAAIDRGVALPEFLVADVPTAFGSYTPRNYDGEFDGLVRLDDALSRSLNVPFVNLLGDVGIEPFLGILRDYGVRSLRDDPGYYGLSVAVGGVELTPLELAGVYAALASGGVRRIPRLLRGQASAQAPLQPLSAGATWLTRRALERRDRPDFPGRRDVGGEATGIHWKTGTSTGRRDAWAVGSGARHTVAVWLGNLDNRGSAAIVGADAAGPLLFDVLGALNPAAVPPDPAPDELGWIEVCAYSGRRPTDACPHRDDVRAVTTSVPTESCPYHRRVEVDVASGLAVTPACRGDRVTEPLTVLTWPAETRRWLRSSRRVLPTLPSWAPGCEPAGSAAPPRIVSPPDGQAAVLIAGLPADDQQVPLQADSSLTGTLSWFVNGRFVGAAPADERVWWTPRVGEHRLVVTDEQGRSARRAFAVLQR